MMKLMWYENTAPLSTHSWQQRLGTAIAAAGICYLLLTALQISPGILPLSQKHEELQVWVREVAKVHRETSVQSSPRTAATSSLNQRHQPVGIGMQQHRNTLPAQSGADGHHPEADPQSIPDASPSVQQQTLSDTDIYAAPRSQLLNPDSLRVAVRDARTDIQKMAQASGHSLQPQPLSNSERTQQQLQQATLPPCTGQDALKFAPAKAGGISFTGLAALPFVAKAALSGKCRFN
ncbi:hypothetical protein KDM88_04460 [Undibacterium sp. BYS50W]|nr:hypothetical protein [Undibacterium rugosum]